MEGLRIESSLVVVLRRCILAGCVLVVAIGLAVMAGWIFHIPVLTSLQPHFVTMKFNTALCLVLSGVALRAQLCVSPVCKKIGCILALVVLTVGVLSLAEYWTGWDFGIDNLLVQEPAGAVATAALGRMAGSTAVAFILIGVALLPVNTTLGWRLLFSQLSALAVLLISFATMIGYFFHDEHFYALGFYSTMALHTAISFCILSLGIVSTRPHCYVMRHITSDALGGVMARRLLPFAILLPVLIGHLHVRGFLGFHPNHVTGETLETLILTMGFILLIGFYARNLNIADVSSRRKEEEHRESNDRFKAIGKATSDAVMDWDLMTNEAWFSESFYNSFGYSPKEATSTIDFWQEGIHPEDKARVLARVQTFIGGAEDSCSSEYRFRHKNGAYATILGRGYLIRDNTGRAVHLVCAMIDMTKQKEKEELQREREVIENRYNFISTISHELRSPMTVIQNAIELVADEADGPIVDQQKEHLEVASHHLARLGRLVSDVLDFQKMELGRRPFCDTPQDMNAIVETVVATFREDAQKKGIAIELHLTPGLPKVLCDKDALEQVMVNLVSNAIKYSVKGHVDVATLCNGDTLRVTVRDEGVGISKENQTKLFQNYYRIYNPNLPRVEGTGLGLAICKKIIDACHGQIGVESELGHGSTFYFTLPVQNG